MSLRKRSLMSLGFDLRIGCLSVAVCRPSPRVFVLTDQALDLDVGYGWCPAFYGGYGLKLTAVTPQRLINFLPFESRQNRPCKPQTFKPRLVGTKHASVFWDSMPQCTPSTPCPPLSYHPGSYQNSGSWY